MNKYVLLALVATLAVPSVAFAQGRSTPATRGQSDSGAQFQTRKNAILQRLNQRMTELQQRQNCVQAAMTREALRACMPQQKEQRQQGQQ